MLLSLLSYVLCAYISIGSVLAFLICVCDPDDVINTLNDALSPYKVPKQAALFFMFAFLALSYPFIIAYMILQGRRK